MGTTPLIHALNETTDKFHHNTNKAPLSDAVLHLAKLDVTALLAVGTGADDKDPDQVVVSVSAPYRIGLPAKELYDDKDILKRYGEVIHQVFSAIYPSSESGSNNSHSLVEFERRLAAASPDAEDRDDVEVSNTGHKEYVI